MIDPALESEISTLPTDTQVSVIIHLTEQAALASMDAELRAEQATLAERHERVVRELQEVASASQPALLADLRNRVKAGDVTGFTPYWIANLVVARMSVAAVREVAARSDVASVYSNPVAAPVDPPDGAALVPDQPDRIESLEGLLPPGLIAINAPRVWHELGVTGAGRLVGHLDTGVQGLHPALISSWRGNHVPWQHAWLDVLEGNTTFPDDPFWGHGTATIGPLLGLDASSADTIGVAWGAEWIACNAIGNRSLPGPEFDNDVIAAFQWFVDPDGNPETVGDMPDVIQNSWLLYSFCDSRFWDVIDACETAGCATIFAAGNDGPDPTTTRPPADRITTPTRNLAVGAVDATHYGFPYPIWQFSSRGPSDCDSVTVKPELVAPGVDVLLTDTNGSYYQWSGTSYAAPQVSGICALMREANPNIDVDTMKQIIMDTAIDLGEPGEDNNFGWGIADAYAAVVAAVSGFGEIEGTVAHSILGVPIANVAIEVIDADRTLTTGLDGRYWGWLPPGTYDFAASHPAFLSETRPGIVVSAGSPITVDFTLDPVPDAVPPEIHQVTVAGASDSCLIAIPDTEGPYTVEATVTDNLGFARTSIHYRTGPVWFEDELAPDGFGLFVGSIPGQPLGTMIEYYIEAIDASENAATRPPGAPAATSSFVVTSFETVFADDAEVDRGWTLGVPGDSATAGVWIRDDPIGTERNGEEFQPEDDHTPDPGITCFVTGNGLPGILACNSNEVDGGCTTLMSPVFDLAGAREAVVRYWRWYAAARITPELVPTPNSFEVDISSDGGSSWQRLERLLLTDPRWVKVEKLIRCEDINLSGAMRLRFVACDGGWDSCIEAAVDDVLIARFGDAAGLGRPDPMPSRRFRLMAANPNPFNPLTLLIFEVPERGSVSLRVFAVTGRLVRVLVDDVLDPGVHSAYFDGADLHGQTCASGTYFIQLKAGDRQVTEKVTILR